MGKKIQCIGRYTMDGVMLGKGNFASVELGTHGVTHIKVAIKIIDTKKIKDEYVRANLYRESRLMATIRHPNIIRLYETLRATNLYCLVTEYAGGGELLAYIKEQPESRLGELPARPFVRQLISAIQYLHVQGIVHRDLKMENVMLDDKKKQIKLIDFGLSNVYKEEEPLRTHCGSPEYAAPELFVVGKTYGPEVDIWSLGIIVYAMIIGRLPFFTPFNDEYHRQRMLAHIQKGLNPFHDHEMKNLSADCRNLLHQLIEPKPDLRIPMNEIMLHPWVTKSGKSPFLSYSAPPKYHNIRNEVIGELAQLMNLKKALVNEQVKDYRADDLSAMYNMMVDEKRRAHGFFDLDHTKATPPHQRRARSHSKEPADGVHTPEVHRKVPALTPSRKTPTTRKSDATSKAKPKNRKAAAAAAHKDSAQSHTTGTRLTVPTYLEPTITECIVSDTLSNPDLPPLEPPPPPPPSEAAVLIRLHDFLPPDVLDQAIENKGHSTPRPPALAVTGPSETTASVVVTTPSRQLANGPISRVQTTATPQHIASTNFAQRKLNLTLDLSVVSRPAPPVVTAPCGGAETGAVTTGATGAAGAASAMDISVSGGMPGIAASYTGQPLLQTTPKRAATAAAAVSSSAFVTVTVTAPFSIAPGAAPVTIASTAPVTAAPVTAPVTAPVAEPSTSAFAVRPSTATTTTAGPAVTRTTITPSPASAIVVPPPARSARPADPQRLNSPGSAPRSAQPPGQLTSPVSRIPVSRSRLKSPTTPLSPLRPNSTVPAASVPVTSRLSLGTPAVNIASVSSSSSSPGPGAQTRARRPSSLQYSVRQVHPIRRTTFNPPLETAASDAGGSRNGSGGVAGVRRTQRVSPRMIAPKATPEDSAIDSSNTSSSADRQLRTIVESCEHPSRTTAVTSGEANEVDRLSQLDYSADSSQQLELCREEASYLIPARTTSNNTTSSRDRVTSSSVTSRNSLPSRDAVTRAVTSAVPRGNGSARSSVLFPLNGTSTVIVSPHSRLPPPTYQLNAAPLSPPAPPHPHPTPPSSVTRVPLAGIDAMSDAVSSQPTNRTSMASVSTAASSKLTSNSSRPTSTTMSSSKPTSASPRSTSTSRSLQASFPNNLDPVVERYKPLSEQLASNNLTAVRVLTSAVDLNLSSSSSSSSSSSFSASRILPPPPPSMSRSRTLMGGSSQQGVARLSLHPSSSVSSHAFSPGSPSYDARHSRFSHIGAHALDVFFSPEEEEQSPPRPLWRPIASASDLQSPSPPRQHAVRLSPRSCTYRSMGNRGGSTGNRQGSVHGGRVEEEEEDDEEEVLSPPLAPIITASDLFSDDEFSLEEEDDVDEDEEDEDEREYRNNLSSSRSGLLVDRFTEDSAAQTRLHSTRRRVDTAHKNDEDDDDDMVCIGVISNARCSKCLSLTDNGGGGSNKRDVGCRGQDGKMVSGASKSDSGGFWKHVKSVTLLGRNNSQGRGRGRGGKGEAGRGEGEEMSCHHCRDDQRLLENRQDGSSETLTSLQSLPNDDTLQSVGTHKSRLPRPSSSSLRQKISVFGSLLQKEKDKTSTSATSHNKRETSSGVSSKLVTSHSLNHRLSNCSTKESSSNSIQDEDDDTRLLKDGSGAGGIGKGGGVPMVSGGSKPKTTWRSGLVRWLHASRTAATVSNNNIITVNKQKAIMNTSAPAINRDVTGNHRNDEWVGGGGRVGQGERGGGDVIFDMRGDGKGELDADRTLTDLTISESLYEFSRNNSLPHVKFSSVRNSLVDVISADPFSMPYSSSRLSAHPSSPHSPGGRTREEVGEVRTRETGSWLEGSEYSDHSSDESAELTSSQIDDHVQRKPNKTSTTTTYNNTTTSSRHVTTGNNKTTVTSRDMRTSRDLTSSGYHPQSRDVTTSRVNKLTSSRQQ